MSFKAASTGHRLDRVPLRRQQLGPSAVRLCLRLRVPRCLGVHLQPRADLVLEIWSENEKRRGRFRKTDPASHGGMLLSGWLRCLTRLPKTIKASSVFENHREFLISYQAIWQNDVNFIAIVTIVLDEAVSGVSDSSILAS